MRHSGSERRLLAKIAENGIKEPLVGVTKGGQHILLDGFKRWRCAKKLNFSSIPFRPISTEESAGIIGFVRYSNAQSLTIVEQACLVNELRRVHGLSVSEIAKRLEKSTAWVSIRCSVFADMSPLVREHVMRGDFPIYSYMYHVRQFMRINKSAPKDADSFVGATAAKGLSQRDIGLLASAYFKGGEEIRRQIDEGKINICLESVHKTDVLSDDCSKQEREIVSDLDLVGRRMRRLSFSIKNATLNSPNFFAKAQLLSGGIIRAIEAFTEGIKNLHDRSRPEKERSRPT